MENKRICFLSGTEEFALTEEEDQRLEENYYDLYYDIIHLHDGLKEYKESHNLYNLNHTCHYFREIIGIIRNAYVAGDRSYCQGRNNKETIDNLCNHGYIDDGTRDMLRQINFYGNAANHTQDDGRPIVDRDFPEIRDVYNELCVYIKTFLTIFPEPGRISIDYLNKFEQIREQELAQKNSKPTGKERLKESGRILIVLLILVVALVVSIWFLGFLLRTLFGVGNADSSSEVETEKVLEHYSVGETWTVDGQWELTIDKVIASPKNDSDPEDESIELYLDYHYTNLGYDEGRGLSIYLVPGYLSGDYITLVDADGLVVSDQGIPTITPQIATIGATASAQCKYNLNSDDHMATLEYSRYDSNHKYHEIIFDLNW